MAITCTSSEKLYTENDTRRCVLQADTMPADGLPVTGEGVSNIDDTVIIAPTSFCLCVDTSDIYILNTENVWCKQTK